MESYAAADALRLAALVVLAGGATFWDLRTRRVPDALTLSGAVAGVAIGLAGGGLAGAGWSLAGLLIGGAVFLAPVALGYVGAGDMKFVAAAGALLGPLGTVRALLVGAVLGGVLGVHDRR